MALEIQAVYEDGVLKPTNPLPFVEHERLTIIVRKAESRARDSVGIVPWSGDDEAFEYLLGPENHPWETK